MQLEITVKQAVGLKHDGRHCVEFLLDDHAPQRTRWVDDLYDTQGLVVQPKNFQSSRCTITLKADKSAYKDSFLHLTLFHQRNVRDDKRAAEAHLPFSGMANRFKGWVSLEHKDKYGGKLYVEANLKEPAPAPPAPAPPRPKAAAPVLDDSELAEQQAILASIQASQRRSQTGQALPARQSSQNSIQSQSQSPSASPSWPWPDSTSTSQAARPPSWPDWPGTAAPAALPPVREPVEADPVLPDWLPWPRFKAALQAGRLEALSRSLEPQRAFPSGEPKATGRRKALLIGLNYPGTSAQLRNGINDVERVAAVLGRLGFPEEWMLKLTDDAPRHGAPEVAPTKSNCIAAMQWLTHNVAPGDVLFFHFSGHATQDDAEGSDALCPSDFMDAGFISSEKVHETLMRGLPAHVRLTMLLDCCIPCLCPELPLLYDLEQDRWVVGSSASSSADVVCFSAAGSEMTLEELNQLRMAEHGFVTSAFLQAMQQLAQQRKGPVTYQELVSEASQHLRPLAHRALQLSVTQMFDPNVRTFRFFDAIKSKVRRACEARLMEFHSSMELTMIINAVSKLRITDEDLFRRFVSRTQSRMGTEAFHVRDISVIVGALARVNCVDATTMSRFADGCVQTLPQATPLELARLMHACMSVSCHAPDLFTACVLQSREQANSMDPSGLSAAAYAFGQCFEVADVSHVRYLQKIFRHLRLAAVSSLPLFLPREIVSLLKTYARWQITFECGHLRKVAERMIATSSQFDLDSAVSGLHNLALLMQRNAMRSERTATLGAAWEVLAEAARNLLLPARAGEPAAVAFCRGAMGLRAPRRPGQALLCSAATFGGLVLLSRSWAFVRLTTRPSVRQQADFGATLRRLPERWSGRRVALHATAEVTEELSGLQEWMEAGCAPSAGVRFVDLPGFKFSLVADEGGVKAGDVLLRVPASMHISPSSVRSSALGRALEPLQLDDSAVLALGLLSEVSKKEQSKFWPYLRILPGASDLHIPLLWPEEDRRRLLVGSPLDLAAEQQRLGLLEQWSSIQAMAKDVPELSSELTEEEWFWAHAIVLTRALPFGNELSLIPGLDLANHELGSNNTCSIGVAAPDGQVVAATEEAQLEGKEPEAVLMAGRDHAAGEQIFIDYDGGVGLRLAWEMVHTYGFVPNNMPAYAGRPVFFEGVQAEDPMARQKQALFEALGADPEVLQGFWHEVRPLRAQCRAMAPKLRLAHMKKEDGPIAADLAAWRAEPKATLQVLQSPISQDNEKKVAEQVLSTCSEALSELPAEEELKDKALVRETENEDPMEVRSRLAARVLLGERLALVWSAARANELDLATLLKAAEAAVALGAGGPELRTLVAGAAMRRQGELDGPTALAFSELLGQLGLHPEDDLMLALADLTTPALYLY
ncbi:Metacaspase-1 [Symbiodinium microadriaticum]|uniref:Metacaspase-1 n=1 Tax=Symbiodinium microadriaticum TaxID=2951 RepID=A0A1Q9DNA4_SYMMI|nr:Metacaspase-1 [Symbiodinium microadriaticum]